MECMRCANRHQLAIGRGPAVPERLEVEPATRSLRDAGTL